MGLVPLARRAADFLFPSRCLACRARPVERPWRGGVCDACWSALPEPDAERCAACDETIPGARTLSGPLPDPTDERGNAASEHSPSKRKGPGSDRLCGRCLLAPPAFETLRAAAPYRGSARRILLAFKFEGADFLAERIAAAMLARLPAPGSDEVAAVPATARRRRERGYHPAALLGAAVARRLGLPFRDERLVKVRETERQSRVPAGRRAANVRRAFAVEGRPPARVLLVDDVATSGSTARECAARLKAAGTSTVEVWCFARATRVEIGTEVW